MKVSKTAKQIIFLFNYNRKRYGMFVEVIDKYNVNIRYTTHSTKYGRITAVYAYQRDSFSFKVLNHSNPTNLDTFLRNSWNVVEMPDKNKRFIMIEMAVLSTLLKDRYTSNFPKQRDVSLILDENADKLYDLAYGIESYSAEIEDPFRASP
jgi:hypothetical protein